MDSQPIGKDEAAQSVQFLADPVWPSIRAAKHADGAAAGPTGAPWVDANGWSIHLAHALQPAKPIWVEAVPEKGTLQNDSAYLLAIADSAANGARWVVSLDDATAQGIAAKEPRSTGRWRKMMSALDFFEKHRHWSAIPARTEPGRALRFRRRKRIHGKGIPQPRRPPLPGLPARSETEP